MTSFLARFGDPVLENTLDSIYSSIAINLGIPRQMTSFSEGRPCPF